MIEKRKKAYLLDPMVELSSLPLPPTCYLKMETDFSFRNVVVVLFNNIDNDRSPKENFTYQMHQKAADFDCMFVF